MNRLQAKRTVLVPIFCGELSEEVIAFASSLLGGGASRLVFLHVAPVEEDATAPSAACTSVCAEPQWRHLVSTAAPDETFVEAVRGDPVEEVLAEADRFHSDLIVLGPPAAAAPSSAWIDRTIRTLARAAPHRVRVTGRRERPRLTNGRTARTVRRAIH